MTNRKNLLAVKTLIENGSRVKLNQVVVKDHGDSLTVTPVETSNFSAIELCGLIELPLSGFFKIEEEKVVLHIF